MNKVFKNSWALFMGMGAIMLAYGYQNALLGVRAVIEDFSLASTGFMMSGYFVGYFIGARTIPSVISGVGHIRVFAAFASVASLAILVHSIFINPLTWFVLRVITGYSMVSIYTIAESWLNDRSSNKNRGKVLSIYMIILYGSMGLGMFMLNFSSPEKFQPFILISVLMSAALLPILLTKRKPPQFKKIQSMSLKDLYNSSPLGMVSAVLYGIVQSALFTLLAVYAAAMNFSIFDISLVTFLLAISGAVSQYPVGYISDKFDRRKVIIYSTFGAAIFAFLAIFSVGTMYLPEGLGSSKLWFYIFLVLFSVCSLPMFSLILAHTNDFITRDKFVAAGAGLQFAFGLGAISGPFLCSLLMGLVGNNGFFVFLIFFHCVIGFYGIHRMKVRPSEDNPDSQFVAVPTTITPVGLELNPSAEPIEEPEKIK
ncbi:MFS transporter [Candidatus Pelagibacter sp.]|nr:MFS transporter [Candidatus Pelagibacter sp.]